MPRINFSRKSPPEETTEKNKIVRNPKDIKMGPIRFIIIDSRGAYCKTVWTSIANGFIQFMLGAVNIMVWGYTIRTGDIHACLCCVGHHFFCAEGILSLNYANGWSTPLRLRHRKLVHIMLQLCGLICVIIGTAMISVSKEISGKPHGLTGLVAAAMTIVTVIIGPLVQYSNNVIAKVVHISFALPTFIVASICLCTALVLDAFQNWAGTTLTIILIFFIFIYTLLIVLMASVVCMMRIKYRK